MPEQSVLIVEDERYIRITLSVALGKLNVSLDTAANGEEALQKLAARPYTVMLLDLRMPGIDGMEVLRRVPEIRPDLKVIIITAYGSVEAAVEAMRLGAVDFLQKPFDPDEVRELVSSLLEQAAHGYENYLELAYQRISGGKFDAARVYAHKAISLEADHPEAFNILGGLCEARGNRLEAEKNYRVALTLNPSYLPAQKNLDRVTRRPYTPLGIDWGMLKK
jgi:DNA-binding response OmpR family regulator